MSPSGIEDYVVLIMWVLEWTQRAHGFPPCNWPKILVAEWQGLMAP